MYKLFSVAAVGALVASGLMATAASASADGRDSSTVSVRSDGTTVSISRHEVPAGQVRFSVSTTSTSNGSNITLFRPAGGVSLTQVFADVGEEFSSDPAVDAKGTRDLTRDARFFGLADVQAGTPAVVSERLGSGTYYLIDLASPPGPSGPVLTTLKVRGSDDSRARSREDDGEDLPTVRLTSSDRFISPRVLPAHGTVNVRNVSDTIHFMSIAPVAKGTTDAEVQAYFDSGSQSQPPFALNGPQVGLDVLSPGNSARLSYRLPAGTYVLLCFVADDVTGMPHALMGMHKVVVLK